MVAGFSNVPSDPFDSGSGDGAGSEGTYTLDLGLDAVDVDVYGFELPPRGHRGQHHQRCGDGARPVRARW